MYINVGTSYLTRSEMFKIVNLTNICRHTIFFFIKNMSKWHLPLPAAANVRRTKCLLSEVLLREKSIPTWMITYMNDTGKNDTGTNGCICHRTGTLGPQKHLLSSASWWHTPSSERINWGRCCLRRYSNESQSSLKSKLIFLARPQDSTFRTAIRIHRTV